MESGKLLKTEKGLNAQSVRSRRWPFAQEQLEKISFCVAVFPVTMKKTSIAPSKGDLHCTLHRAVHQQRKKARSGSSGTRCRNKGQPRNKGQSSSGCWEGEEEFKPWTRVSEEWMQSEISNLPTKELLYFSFLLVIVFDPQHDLTKKKVKKNVQSKYFIASCLVGYVPCDAQRVCTALFTHKRYIAIRWPFFQVDVFVRVRGGGSDFTTIERMSLSSVFSGVPWAKRQRLVFGFMHSPQALR